MSFFSWAICECVWAGDIRWKIVKGKKWFLFYSRLLSFLYHCLLLRAVACPVSTPISGPFFSITSGNPAVATKKDFLLASFNPVNLFIQHWLSGAMERLAVDWKDILLLTDGRGRTHGELVGCMLCIIYTAKLLDIYVRYITDWWDITVV